MSELFPAGDPRALPDPEADRTKGEALSLEFARPGRRADRGKKSIEDSPIFGGERQGELFE